MRYLAILVGSFTLAAAACASNNNPPAASSVTVGQASNEPSRGPDFAPASRDGLAAAPRDTRRANNPTQSAPNLNPTSPQTPQAANRGSEANDTRGNGAEGSSGMNPATGNAAAVPADRAKEPATDADNSRVNRRDRSGSTLTPMDQGPSDADRKVTRDIRQAVMKDSSLSFTAKNVKIITVNGKVTLRGPVKNEAERAAIEAAARKVVGNGALVESELELMQ